MAITDILKKIVRTEDTIEEDGANYYRPRQKAAPATIIDEPDDDLFTAAKKTSARAAVRAADDYDDLDGDDPDELIGKPRFKRVMATGVKSAEHAVDLALRKYVVLVNVDSVPADALANVQFYLAGAIHALDAHVTPLDDTNYFISLEPFDASPYLPHDEQDSLEEQEDDLI